VNCYINASFGRELKVLLLGPAGPILAKLNVNSPKLHSLYLMITGFSEQMSVIPAVIYATGSGNCLLDLTTYMRSSLYSCHTFYVHTVKVTAFLSFMKIFFLSPLSLVSITEELLEWKGSSSGYRKPRLTAVEICCADHATPSISKSWH
jgi:hypothetical protein